MAITPMTFNRAKRVLNGKANLADSLEVYIDRILTTGCRKSIDLLGISIKITPEIQKEIAKRYKKAGWKSVIFRHNKKYPCLTIYFNYYFTISENIRGKKWL